MFTLHISHQSVDPRKEEAPTQKARLLLILDKARVKGYWRTLETGPVWVSSHQRRGEAHAKPTGNQLGLFGNAPTPQLTMFGGPPPSEHTTQPRPLQHEPAHAQAKPEPEPARPYRPLTEDAIHNWDTPYIQKQYGELPEDIRQAAQEAMRRHHQKGTDAREEAQALNARFGLTPKPEPAKEPQRQPEAEPGKQPWQMTRAEFRAQENAPKVKAIQDAIRSGKQIMVATQLRGTLLTSPEHIRMTSAGHVQTRERTTWVNLTEDKVDALAAQAGYPVPDVMDKVYHHAEVEQALKDGKPVPPEVLAAYPDLTQQEEEPEPEPEPPPARQPRARRAPEETYPVRYGGRFNFTSPEVDQIVAMMRERATGADHPTLRLRPQVKEYALAYDLLQQPDKNTRPTYNTSGRFQPLHDLPPEALWRIVEPMLGGERSRGISITGDQRWHALDIPPVGDKLHRAGAWKEIPGEGGEESTWVQDDDRRAKSEHGAMEAQADILQKLAQHNYVYFQRGGSIWEVSKHESQRQKPAPAQAQPDRSALAFPADDKRPSKAERDQATAAVEALEKPLRDFELHLGGPNAPESRFRGLLNFYPGARPGSVGTHYRGVIQGFRHRGDPHPTQTRASLHHAVAGAKHDMAYTGKKYIALATERGMRAEDLPAGPLRDTFARYAPENSAMSKAHRPRGTGLVIYLDKARVRGHWRILESGPTYVTGYQRRDQPGHHIAEPAHQMRLFGDEPKPQLVLLRQPPEPEPPPADPPVFTRPPPVLPEPSPLLSFPRDRQTPSRDERAEAEQAVYEIEKPIHLFAEHLLTAPGSEIRSALLAHQGYTPHVGRAARERLLDGAASPTRSAVHAIVDGAARDLTHAGQQYVAVAMQHGVTASALPAGPERDTFTRYADNNPYMRGKTVPTEVRPPPPPTPEPALPFPADDRRPSKTERAQASAAVDALEQPLHDFERYFTGPSAPDTPLRGRLHFYTGTTPGSVGTHYRSAIQGLKRRGDPHPTPTRASLHQAVARAEQDLEYPGKKYIALALETGIQASDLPAGPLRNTFHQYAAKLAAEPLPEPLPPPEPAEPPTYRSLALSLERANNVPVRDIHMQSAGDVAAIFAHLRSAEREKLMAIHVDENNDVVNVECISVGGLTESMANVREVLKAAVVQHTPGLWLLHNHPSGDPTPSKADDDVTKLVHQYGKRLGITLHGHIVVGETHYAHITPEGGGVAQHYPYAPVTGEPQESVPEITVMQWRLPEPALQGKQIRSAADAASIGKELMHGTAQQSYLLVLDQKNKINAAVPLPTTGTGLARQNALNEALRQAILHNGRNCILVSDVDNAGAFQSFTQAFKDSLKGVPITLLDGVRLLPQGHASMADQGLLKALVLYLDKARRLHGRRRIGGLYISIENRKGSIRRGVDHAGKPWETKLPLSYGYVRRSAGLDGDQVDVFVKGDHPESCPVFLVTLMRPPNFTVPEEQKAFLGLTSSAEVKELFCRMYKDPRQMGPILEMPFATFKEKVLATGKEPGALQAV